MKYMTETKRLALAATVITVFLLAGCSKKSNSDAEHEPAQEQRVNNIPIDTALSRRLADFAARPRPQGQFAFYVYDLTAEKPVYGCNETLALPSASCMKLLSGIAGLDLLGTNYHYQTQLLMRGKVGAEGMLNGDVAFKASLDPQLMEADVVTLAKGLKEKGIKRMTGKLYVDLTIAEPVKSEPHWFPWDLSFSKYGLFYKGAPRVVRALKASLRGQGIAVADSQVVMSPVPQGFTCVSTLKRPVDDVVRRMWKNSSNTQATAMLYTIGHRINPQADPVAIGVKYLRDFLHRKIGMTDSTLVVHDGCGLCIYNRLSPKALTEILRYGYMRPDIRMSLQRNLSVSGTDGTLAREMTGPKTRGKIWGKTGTLSHPYGISSLAGLCKGANGHTLAFAIMDSEMSVLDARVLQRRLCEVMVE